MQAERYIPVLALTFSYLPHGTDTLSCRDNHKATSQRKGLDQLSCLQSSKAPSHFSFRHGFHIHSQGSLLQCDRQIRQHQTVQHRTPVQILLIQFRIYRIFSNLIRTSFFFFFKRKKVSSRFLSAPFLQPPLAYKAD
jgi:hypothetical protein